MKTAGIGRRVRSGPNTQVLVTPLLAAMCACLLFLTVVSDARASVPGEPARFDFNHASLFTETITAGPVDDWILRPGDGAGPVSIRGTYSDAEGNFTTLPSDFSVPAFEIRLGDLASFEGSLEQVGRARGSFDEDTGQLSFEPFLALTFGSDDLGSLFSYGSDEPFECTVSPLSVSFSTGKGWPHPGQRLTGDGGFTTGSLAGAWRSRPPVEGGGLCSALLSLVAPVGGLWLSNSPTLLTSIPAATEPHPSPLPFVAPPAPAADITGVSMPARVMRARSGSVFRLPLTISNAGIAAADVKVRLESNRKWARAPKRYSVRVPAGRTVSRDIPVRIAKRARGMVRLSVRVGDHVGKMRVRIR